MKKITSIILMTALFLSVSLFSGCSRQPTVKRTENIMQSYFKKYAKKYPESVLGKYKAEDVDVLHIEELQKDLVVAYALVKLEGGVALQTRFTIQKKALGWRAISWENMGMAMQGGTRR